MQLCVYVCMRYSDTHMCRIPYRGGQRGHPWAMLFICYLKIDSVLVEISVDMFTTIIIAMCAICDCLHEHSAHSNYNSGEHVYRNFNQHQVYFQVHINSIAQG